MTHRIAGLALAVALMAACAAPGALACTSLIAAKGATADGSVMCTYAADSHNLYGELYHAPGGKHAPGSMRPVVEWDTHRALGEIPQAPETYSRVGNTNEWGVTVVESTWGGRPELEGTGLLDYGSLIYISLERARTAREALQVFTDLAQEYGYASEGESITFADPDEAWVMDIIGKGKAGKGAVWVARRVPDGYISGHANNPRIHRFPLDDKETLYSPDVIDFARQQGYYEGPDEDFDFAGAYGVLDFGALRGCDARVWAYFNKFADGMDRWLPWIDRAEGEPMPLWVKPRRPLTADDLKWMMRDHYEGTPYDMTLDVGAGPYHVPYRWRPMSFTVDGREYTHERAIATQQTGFSLVSQMRADMPRGMRSLMWFGTDDANTSVYLPVFGGLSQVPPSLGPGDTNTFDPNSNFWMNSVVANQAYNRYSKMIPDIRRVQKQLEDSINAEAQQALERLPGLPGAERQEAVDALAARWAARATDAYRDLGQWLFVKYMDGNVKKTEADGVTFLRTPEGIPAYPDFGGYDDERYYRNIVRDTGDHLLVKPVSR